MPNKVRATNPPPEKTGGEGWLVSAEQQLVCQFKADSATDHAQLGCGQHLSLDAATSPGAANPQANASAQRHRGVGQDAQNRLAAVLTTSALTLAFWS